MNYDYIRLLMLYSDVKYPFEKAKADPGLTEGLKSVRQYLQNNSSRRENASDINRMLLLEKQTKQRMEMDERMKRMTEVIKSKKLNIPNADERDKE